MSPFIPKGALLQIRHDRGSTLPLIGGCGSCAFRCMKPCDPELKSAGRRANQYCIITEGKHARTAFTYFKLTAATLLVPAPCGGATGTGDDDFGKPIIAIIANLSSCLATHLKNMVSWLPARCS